jgi:hypothetical protein
MTDLNNLFLSGTTSTVAALAEPAPRCSREYGRVDDPDEKTWPRIGKGQTVPETPFLLSMGLDKNGAGFLAYLPEVAYWALQADLKSGRLKFIEASFAKPRYGAGDLTSINSSETPPKEP